MSKLAYLSYAFGFLFMFLAWGGLSYAIGRIMWPCPIGFILIPVASYTVIGVVVNGFLCSPYPPRVILGWPLLMFMWVPKVCHFFMGWG